MEVTGVVDEDEDGEGSMFGLGTPVTGTETLVPRIATLMVEISSIC